jgi:hypothetical protein
MMLSDVCRELNVLGDVIKFVQICPRCHVLFILRQFKLIDGIPI